MLRAALLTDHCKAEHVAANFSMHSRTLSRRLDSSGTSFQKLADQCRFEIAQQLLGDTDMHGARIAATLGYADVSTFTRALRRWSGTTPARWRAMRREHCLMVRQDKSLSAGDEETG